MGEQDYKTGDNALYAKDGILTEVEILNKTLENGILTYRLKKEDGTEFTCSKNLNENPWRLHRTEKDLTDNL